MSYIKNFLEEVSEKSGFQGKITKAVIQEAQKKMGKIGKEEPTEQESLIDENNMVINKKFFSAGKAVFTIHNSSGKHYTFKIKHKKAQAHRNEWQYKMPFYVYILTAPDTYTYMGVYNPKKNSVYVTKSSSYTKNTEPVKVVNWGLRMVAENGNWNKAEGYGIKAEGKCARCGRALTTPDSIKAGIGPECIKSL